MDVLVINLDRARERLAHTTSVFADAGVEFQRVVAVEGDALGEEDIAKWRRGDSHFYPLPPSELACFLSHRRCWERVAENATPAAIFEDDVHLGRDPAFVLGNDAWIPGDADIVRLETDLSTTCFDKTAVREIGMRRIVRLRGRHTGGAGYILTPKGAAKLLAALGPIADPFDQLIFNPEFPLFHELAIYQFVPALCIQDDILHRGRAGVLASYIEHDRHLPRRSGLAKILREIERPVQQGVRLLRQIFANSFTDRQCQSIPFQ